MTDAPKRNLSSEEVLFQVRWRFRICSYLFNLAFLWLLGGGIWFEATSNSSDAATAFSLMLIGAGIFTVAFTMTLAIYRCPVCDKYLSRFRPQREVCPRCEARLFP